MREYIETMQQLAVEFHAAGLDIEQHMVSAYEISVVTSGTLADALRTILQAHLAFVPPRPAWENEFLDRYNKKLKHARIVAIPKSRT